MNRKCVVITGASDGIGRALAWEMADRGYNLGLTARRIAVLNELKADIQGKYPDLDVCVAKLDVTNFSSVRGVLLALREQLTTIDIIVANAGIARSGRIGVMGLEEQLSVIDTNLNGAIATISIAVEMFREQGFGHVVATSSIAGFLGLPRNAAYSASKAGLSIYLEALRAETFNENIDVTVINPGFIDTELNRGMKSRPFVISVNKGARQFANVIERKVAVATVPAYPWGVLGRLMKYLPTSLIAKM